ncbi:MAG: ATP-binding protein [Methanophagales archaeon]|nr:ATP-binding protein [Methanophagales archaeon]
MIGPNASGKTNFVELFTLLKRIYADREPFDVDNLPLDNVLTKRPLCSVVGRFHI